MTAAPGFERRLGRTCVRDHFTKLLTDEQLRDVAGALEVITGPHEPH